MAEVIVIAGTADARQIIGKLADMGIKAAATVATGFGAQLLEGIDGVKVFEGRLDAEGLSRLIKSEGARLLIDASHPYASEVSANAKAACERAGVPCLRYERGETPLTYERIIKVDSFEDAAAKLNDYEGNVFIAVGSKSIRTFTEKVSGFKKRLFARVLPQSEALMACEKAGLTAENILAVKGPFSTEMNVEMLKHCRACVMVTKDGGSAGGTAEKIEACRRLGIPVILVRRPASGSADTVGTVEETVSRAAEYLKGDG